MTADFSAIVDDLSTTGWNVTRDFLSPADVDALLKLEAQLWANGEFRLASVGSREQRSLQPEIRSDRIHWLDPRDVPDAVLPYWHLIDDLKSELNQTLYLGLRRFEAHFAVYPPGAFYEKHFDQFKTTSNRIISCILYLNKHWKSEYGGQLRIYPPDASVESFEDVIPEAGTLVCFLSDRILHEVLPATHERFSLTGWLRRDPA